jgi:hypothetical protein
MAGHEAPQSDHTSEDGIAVQIANQRLLWRSSVRLFLILPFTKTKARTNRALLVLLKCLHFRTQH